MTPSLDATLRDAFPQLFARLDEPIRTGDGWYHLLWLACAGLESLVDLESDDLRVDVEPYQLLCVKEKFGALELYTDNMCFYHMPPFRDVYDLVRRMSLSTCDVCGKSGRLRGGAGDPYAERPMLMRTRCDEHVNWFEPRTGFAHKTQP